MFALGVQVGLIYMMAYYAFQDKIESMFICAALLGLVGIVSRLERLEKKIDALGDKK